MGYYLLGGFSLEEGLHKKRGCWKRNDLVDCPEILNYSMEVEEDVVFYQNNMDCTIFVLRYDVFSSVDDMWSDYDSEMPECIYIKRYNYLLEKIHEKYDVALDDVSWIMPLITDSIVGFHESYVMIESDINIETKDYVTLIDCAMIYQVLDVISVFFRKLSTKEDLDRFEQYQLSFYMQTLNIIAKPSYYLTNAKEVELYTRLYEVWKMSDQISVTSELAGKTIEVFEFLGTYRKKNKINLAEFFLPYISFVLSYNSIIEVAVFFIPQLANHIEYIVKLILLIGFVITCISLVKALRLVHMMNRRFENKTKEN